MIVEEKVPSVPSSLTIRPASHNMLLTMTSIILACFDFTKIKIVVHFVILKTSNHNKTIPAFVSLNFEVFRRKGVIQNRCKFGLGAIGTDKINILTC